MKYLYLIRHAKSDWSDIFVSDHDRDLNKRGKKDAPFMADVFKKRVKKVDALFSSSAKRAQKSAHFFASSLNLSVKVKEQIYEATPKTLTDIIKKEFKKYDSIALIGHNPTLNELIHTFGIDSIQNIPTCAIVGVGFDDEKLSNPSFLFFEYPKAYKN